MTDYVVEESWVGILMDIGSARKSLDEVAKVRDERWYGEGWTDELMNPNIPAYSRMLELSEMRWNERPNSWTRAISFTCNSVLFSQSPHMLREHLIDLAVITVAWIEDLDRRAGDIAS